MVYVDISFLFDSHQHYRHGDVHVDRFIAFYLDAEVIEVEVLVYVDWLDEHIECLVECADLVVAEIQVEAERLVDESRDASVYVVVRSENDSHVADHDWICYLAEVVEFLENFESVWRFVAWTVIATVEPSHSAKRNVLHADNTAIHIDLCADEIGACPSIDDAVVCVIRIEEDGVGVVFVACEFRCRYLSGSVSARCDVSELASAAASIRHELAPRMVVEEFVSTESIELVATIAGLVS